MERKVRMVGMLFHFFCWGGYKIYVIEIYQGQDDMAGLCSSKHCNVDGKI